MRGRRLALLLAALLAGGPDAVARSPDPRPAAKPAAAKPAPRPKPGRPALAPPAVPQAAAKPAEPPPRFWPPPGRFPLPACPPLLAAFAEGIQPCRCAPAAMATGPVLGAGPYAGGAAPCRAGLHAGAIGPRGGDLVIRVLPLPGEAPGGVRNGVAAQPGRLDGRAYAVLPGTPGQLDYARRLAQALATPNPPPLRMPGRAEALVPLPPPQAADPGDLLDPAPGPGRPSLARLSPPVLMPALWRSPVRPPDATPPPGEAPPAPTIVAPLPPPIPPGPVAGPAQVLGPARLMVAGVALDLADIAPGEDGDAAVLGELLARQGGTASCEPVALTPRHRCMTPTGIDLAEAALYNGLSRVTLEASDAYRYAERAAREARRGIWKAETR